MKRNSYHVAVLVEPFTGYGRGLCRGIGLFAQEHPDWHITYAPMMLDKPLPRWFGDWHGQGILTRIADSALLPEVQAKRVCRAQLLLQEGGRDAADVGRAAASTATAGISQAHKYFSTQPSQSRSPPIAGGLVF